MTLVNKTRWRTDHLRAVVSRALREEGVPEVRVGRLVVWVKQGIPGALRSWGYPKHNQIVIALPPTSWRMLSSRMVGRLTLQAAAELLGRGRSDKSAWWAETLPLGQRGPTPPTKEQAAMGRFRRAAARAKTWKRKLRLATTMYRKWTRRAARLHGALNQGMAGRPKP